MKNKDWTGNKKSTFVTLGASNHGETIIKWLFDENEEEEWGEDL